MTIAGIEKEYLKLLEEGSIPADERLSISKGILADGTPTPPRVLAKLFLDNTIAVREEAKKSILILQENELSKIASDDATHSSLLLLLAKHFHDSPSVGISIISNKNTTEKILFYLQGRGGEVDDDFDEELIDGGGDIQGERRDDIEIGEEIEIEIGEEIEIEISEDEGIGLEVPSGEDIDGEISSVGTPDLTATPEARQGEEVFEFVPESYTDGDIEVIIELDETDDIDDEEEEIVINDKGESGDIDIGIIHHDEGEQIIGDDFPFKQEVHLDKEENGFATTIDSIEDKVGEIFDIDLGDIDIQGDKTLGATGGGIGFEADSDISGMETPVEEDTPFKSQEPVSDFGGGVDERLTETDREKMEVFLPSERFVTRISSKKYAYKVPLVELFAKVAKILVPVAVVVLAFFMLWVLLPNEVAFVEEFDSGINRVFVKTKMEGLDPKLKDPFPKGSSIYNWKPEKVREEIDFNPGGKVSGYKKLKEDLLGFETKYKRELEYEKVSEEFSKKKKSLSTASKKSKAVNEEFSLLLKEKDGYLERYKGEKLKKRTVTDERDKEIREFKKLFETEKSKIEKIESDMAGAKERIAEFERDNIPTADDHGYYANKRELEELTKEYSKLKPKFDNFNSRYKGILNKLENKYKQKLSIVERIEVIDREVSGLNMEKTRFGVEKRILEEDIKKLEDRMGKLEKAKATGEKITVKNLPIFLVMSKYIREHEQPQLDSELNGNDEISYFEIYTIKQKKADIAITLNNKEGKKEKKKYSITFMRMITKKKILIFEWDVKTTKWVLTSISEKKK